MKRRMRWWAAGTLIAMTVAWAAESRPDIPGQGTKLIMIRPGGKLWLEGSAPMHGFEATATRVTLVMGVDSSGGKAPWPEILTKGRMKELAIIIPVLGLESGKADLDDNLYRAMKAKEFALITFTLKGYAAKSEKDGSYAVQMGGVLSIAGQAKPVQLVAKAMPMGERLLFSGQKEVLMREFGIEPPSMMLGMITTDNRVVVKFDFILDAVQGEKGPGSPQGEGK